MEKITLGGVDYECSPEMKKAIEDALAAAGKSSTDDDDKKDDDKKVEELKSANDALQAKLDGVNAELVKAKSAANDGAGTAEKIRAAVKARIALETTARRVLDEKACATLDAMSDRDLKAAVVKAAQPGAVLDGKSDTYVDARFDTVVESLDAADKDREDLGKGIAKRRSEAATDEVDSEAARKRQMERAQNAWKVEAAKK